MDRDGSSGLKRNRRVHRDPPKPQREAKKACGGKLMKSAMLKDQKKIKAKIGRYERSLRDEQTRTGFISDGYGKRYLLGPLHMQLGDIEGALDSFDWYENAFPDDVGEPFQYLCWALALFKVGRIDEARKKLVNTMIMNLYLVPHLLNMEIARFDIWHFTNTAEPEYLNYLPEEYVDLWDEDSLAWAKSVYENANVKVILNNFIAIRKTLKHERPGPVRFQLMEEEEKLIQSI